MRQLIRAEFEYLKGLAFRGEKIGLGSGLTNNNVLLLLVGFYLIVDLLANSAIMFPVNYLFPEINEAYVDLEELGKFEMLLFGVILVPPLEELIFRLPLKASTRNLRIWLLAMMIIGFFVHYLVAIFILIISVILLKKADGLEFDYRLKKFYKKNDSLIFWLFTLAFAAMHITNFNFEALPVYLYPIAIIPQVIGGIILGIIRLRFGFLWAIFYHSLFNFVVTIVFG